MEYRPNQDSTLPRGYPQPGVAENQFIVRYKDGFSDQERHEHQTAIHGIARQRPGFDGVGATWNMGSFKGYHVHIDPDDLSHIHNSSLGLGRISHHDKGHTNYYYNETVGEGVGIYVINTGILVSHNEFGGRARWGQNFANSVNTDQDGHGTHCAGTAIGATYGVAKKASAIAVKVLDENGLGWLSWVISGIEWAYNNAGNARDKAAISMSLGGSYSKALNDAVAAATAGGMTVSVAAGNEDKDVAGFSPASAQSAITVAAIDSNDYRASFSNWGSGVDVFAAGVDVTSAWIGSNSATNTISGTSMACPHVSGLAAYYIRLFNLSGKAVKEKIISTATKDKVIDPKGSPNRIAYNSSEAEAAGY